MGFELVPGIDFQVQDMWTLALTIFFLKKSTRHRGTSDVMVQTVVVLLSSH